MLQGDAAKLGAVYDSIASGFVEKGLDVSAVEPVRFERYNHCTSRIDGQWLQSITPDHR